MSQAFVYQLFAYGSTGTANNCYGPTKFVSPYRTNIINAIAKQLRQPNRCSIPACKFSGAVGMIDLGSVNGGKPFTRRVWPTRPPVTPSEGC